MTCGTKDGELHIYTPLQAMRRKCLDCCCDSAYEVNRCTVYDCALYPYRFGKNPPGRGRRLTEEQKQLARENLIKAREKRTG